LQARRALCSFGAAYESGPEVAAEELRGAVRELAAISGHVTVDEHILDALFGEFCIGK